MALVERPAFGARDLVYALMDEGTDTSSAFPTYGTIYAVPGLRRVAVNVNSSGSTLFGDDGPRNSAETVGEIDLEFEIIDLLPAHEARLLGHTYSSGQLQKSVQDVSPYIAVGFKITREDGESSYIWLYKGKMMKPSSDNATKESSINYQTPTLMGKFVGLQYNDLYMNKVRTDDSNASAVVSGFFSAVTEPTADNTALTATISVSGGNARITFAKGSGSSFGIDSDTVTSSTIIVSTASGLEAGSFAVGANGTTVNVDFTPTVAFSGGEDVGVAVTNLVKDNSGVSATVTGDVLTF